MNILSWFQSPSGGLHLPSLLALIGWMAASIIMFVNLAIAKNDRFSAASEKQKREEQESVDRERIELLQLKATPRRLEGDDLTKLSSRIASLGKHSVTIFPNGIASETQQYANDIAKCFRMAGWSADLSPGTVVLGDTPIKNVVFFINSIHTAPDWGTKLIKIFLEFDLDVTWSESPKYVPAGELHIFIGEKL